MHGAQGVKPLCVEVSSVGLTRDKEVKKEKQLHSVQIFFSIRNGAHHGELYIPGTPNDRYF